MGQIREEVMENCSPTKGPGLCDPGWRQGLEWRETVRVRKLGEAGGG